MNNYFTVDYDKRKLVIFYEEQTFVFDLDDGDMGDFWNSLVTNERIVLDVNFYQEDENQEPSVSLYGTFRDAGGDLMCDMTDDTPIPFKSSKGYAKKYFAL